MIEFLEINRSDAINGSFPLNHDCILKVSFITDCGHFTQYFSCRAQDSGQIVLIISQLYTVKKVECSSVDNFCL